MVVAFLRFQTLYRARGVRGKVPLPPLTGRNSIEKREGALLRGDGQHTASLPTSPKASSVTGAPLTTSTRYSGDPESASSPGSVCSPHIAIEQVGRAVHAQEGTSVPPLWCPTSPGAPLDGVPACLPKMDFSAFFPFSWVPQRWSLSCWHKHPLPMAF